MRILKIYRDNCPPCKALASLLNKMNLEHESAQATPEIAAEYALKAVPALIFFDEEGNIVDRLLGLPTEEMIRRRINDS